MPPDSRDRVTSGQLGSPAHVRRAERALQKDLRFMIRENARRRARNEKGPGGVRRPDEFAELRRAKVDVSRRAAELVEDEFGRGAARMFRLRSNVRMALSFVPDWAAKLLPRGAGRPNRSRYDEGRQNGADVQDHSGPAPVVNPDQRERAADWVNAAEGRKELRTAHTAAALSELMTASRDLQIWFRTEPGALNRTRDLFATAEQRHVELTGPPADLSSYQYVGQSPLGPVPLAEYPGQDLGSQYQGQGQWAQPTAAAQWPQPTGPAQWSQQEGAAQWSQQEGAAQWSQPAAPAQWSQPTSPVQWSEPTGPAQWSQQESAAQWQPTAPAQSSQPTAPAQWSQPTGPAQWSQESAAQWSQREPAHWQQTAPAQWQQAAPAQWQQAAPVRRKALSDNAQIARAASLTSDVPTVPGSPSTPPPVRQATPKPRRALS